MDSPPLRVAIAGYGISGELSHADPIHQMDEFRIAAVCDLSNDRLRCAATKHHCPTYRDFKEMIQGEPLDLVCIVTRSDTHCHLACEALAAGINILVTKPWALNAAEGERILEALEASTGQLFPWIPLYYSPDYRKITALLQAEAIGRVFKIRRYITDFRWRDDWQTRKTYGGGYLLNWGAHIVQPILGLAKRPVRSVYGQFQQVINPGDAEDNFSAHIVFDGDLHGIAEFTQAMEGLPAFLVQGTKGMILADDTQTVLLQKDPASGEEPVRTAFPHPSKYFGDEQEIYRDVARSIRTGSPFPISPQTAMEGTRILDAIRESVDSGQVISLQT